MGGEFIVQAKRYRNVVPANDVRALAGVMHDKRANHAIFVTTAWFSDDGRRFALDNRVRLIEGPELSTCCACTSDSTSSSHPHAASSGI